MAATMTMRRDRKDSKQNRWRSTEVAQNRNEKKAGGCTLRDSRNEYPHSSRSCTHQLVTLFFSFSFFRHSLVRVISPNRSLR